MTWSSAVSVQVFKAAKALAPSVVFIDEVEKVFITDKARAKQFGGKELFSRIKKQLITEVRPAGISWSWLPSLKVHI